jgi:acyl dehydratase
VDTGADADSAAFEAALQGLIGQPMGTGESIAPDPVNQPMIRHWAAAFEDHNPIYVDPEFAATTRFGEVVAPPLMLQTWTMGTPTITGIRERGGAPNEVGGRGPLAVLDDAGFTSTLASNSEFEIMRYLRLGETVRARTVVESVSARKSTRVGTGYFVTWTTTYVVDGADGDDEVVGLQRFRVLKFRPASVTAAGGAA